MNTASFFSILALLAGVSSASFAQGVETGKAAPDFTTQGQDGKTYKLSDYKGKIVVLEWYNDGCPYVVKHYASNNMQNLQKKYTDKGVTWLTIASNAPGKEGHLTAERAKELRTKQKSNSTVTLLDESGTIGKLYAAKTTPHMFVIDQKGTVVYQGAIDSNNSSRQAAIKDPKTKNYVSLALDAVLAGTTVAENTTTPYGCSVKYKN